jgi:hypothetical protein
MLRFDEDALPGHSKASCGGGGSKPKKFLTDGDALNGRGTTRIAAHASDFFFKRRLFVAYTIRRKGHTYVYQVDYGEDAAVALIVVRSDAKNAEGLFLVKQDGSVEPAHDRPGFGTNRLSHDGLWPAPPREAIADARVIAQQKAHTAS